MPQIPIFIKSPEGKSVCLNVANDATITFVKMMIEDRFLVLGLTVPSWKFHYLLYQGQIIQDNWSLDDMRVKPNDTIWMRVRAISRLGKGIKISDQYQNVADQVAKKATSRQYFKDKVLSEIIKGR